MKVFDGWPDDEVCPICNTSSQEKCVLAVMDGTGDGNICQAMPVHLGCVVKNLRYSSKINVFYVEARSVDHEAT